MAFKITVKQDVANITGHSRHIVDNLTVNNGYITVGSYHVPLSEIVMIEEFIQE